MTLDPSDVLGYGDEWGVFIQRRRGGYSLHMPYGAAAPLLILSLVLEPPGP